MQRSNDVRTRHDEGTTQSSQSVSLETLYLTHTFVVTIESSHFPCCCCVWDRTPALFAGGVCDHLVKQTRRRNAGRVMMDATCWEPRRSSTHVVGVVHFRAVLVICCVHMPPLLSPYMDISTRLQTQFLCRHWRQRNDVPDARAMRFNYPFPLERGRLP